MVGYCRVSSEKQGRSGLGIDAQKMAIETYRKSSGLELVAEYLEVETGTKRGLGNRPELAAAIDHAKRSKAILVIAKLDRLSRNVAFISNLLESGVEFVACDNPSANRMTVHILAAVAENEARLISERTKAALAAAKARGTKLGTNNLTRAGALKGAASSSVSRSKAKVEAYSYVRPRIALMRSAGLSLRSIAQSLNDAGETARSGGLWNAVQVSRVLRGSPTDIF